MNIRPGIPDDQRATAIALYWQAFSGKLGKVMGPHQKALHFIDRVLGPDHAISAIAPDGTLLGIAGFKTSKGALVGGEWGDLWAVYGVSAVWRAGLLTMLERDIENQRFLMDGLFVAPTARGQGVGTALLHALYSEAKSRGYREIRLDVIDSNTRARALYEREGFKETKTEHIGLLRHIFGFSTSTTMVRQI
jgi:ribosomal protein S18 acetylase RimI-like enzyme